MFLVILGCYGILNTISESIAAKLACPQVIIEKQKENKINKFSFFIMLTSYE